MSSSRRPSSRQEDEISEQAWARADPSRPHAPTGSSQAAPRIVADSVLRGREPELAAIGDQLAAAARGRGGVLVVEGPPGIGKSSLLRAAEVTARREAVRPLLGEAFESRRGVPFDPLLAAVLDARPPLVSAETARTLRLPPELHYWVIHDLQDVLERAAMEAPLLVVIDDLQWADAGTVAALGTLTSRLSGMPILWLLAMRGGELRPETRAVVRRLERDGARRMDVAPLSEEAVAAVILDTVAAKADPALVTLADSARGNPFLLVELLVGLREEGRLRIENGRAVVAGEALPRRLTDSMRERLDRLSEDARQVVRVAAALGDRFSVDQLARVVQRPPAALVPAVDEALVADLLVERDGRLAFRHDLLRQAAVETLSPALGRALLREAATALIESGATPVEVAQQLADSAEVGDREAVATMREAARALARSDVGAAADLSVRALELMPPRGDQRGPLVADTVVLLHSAARTDEARALGEGALSGALTSDEEAEVRLSLSSMVMRSPVDRAEENRRALALSGLTPVMRARHLGWLAFNLATVSGDEAIAVARTAEAAARELGDLQAQVMASLGLICVDCTEGRCVRALSRTDRLRDLTRGVEAEPYLQIVDFFRATALTESGRVDEALAAMLSAVAKGRRERNAWLLETWTQYGSALRYAAGQLADARAEAESADRGVEQVWGANHAAVAGMLTLGQVAIHTADARQVKASVAAAHLAYDIGGPVPRRTAASLLALVAMGRGDPAGAARWLSGIAPFAMPVLPRDAGHQPTVARIAVAAGDPDLARRAVEVAERLASDNPAVAVAEAAAAQTRGLVDGDAAALVSAAAMFRPTQRPMLFAAAAEDAAAALARRGHTADAIARLNEAFDVFLGCEAVVDARRVAAGLRELGVRRPVPSRERAQSGWGSLTESELRVARLVARGATNRDAAEQLFLSPHTVSSHLRSAFAKLGVRSRVELARVAFQEE